MPTESGMGGSGGEQAMVWDGVVVERRGRTGAGGGCALGTLAPASLALPPACPQVPGRLWPWCV